MDLEHPDRAHYSEQQWICRAHEQGHGGIDIFVGQRFQPAQMQRYQMYLSHQAWDIMPSHCQMFAWYYQLHPEEVFCECGDFDFAKDVSEMSHMWQRYVSQEEVLDYQDWPFEPISTNGGTLVERLRQRAATAREYAVHQCIADWDHCRDSYRMETEHMVSFGQRRHLEMIHGELYVKLGEERGWWLVVHTGRIREVSMYAGWVPPLLLSGQIHRMNKYAELPCLIQSEQRAAGIFTAPLCSPAPTLARNDDGIVSFAAPLLPPPQILRGDKVPRRDADVACLVDGCMGNSGFAAAFVCLGVHLGGRCSLQEAVHGGEAVLLAGILLAALHLMRLDFGSVVFLLPSSRVASYVFAEYEPTDEEGVLLYPGVLACRHVLRRLASFGIRVSGKHVPAVRTRRARLMAQAEIDTREEYWRRRDNLWERPLTPPLQRIFAEMALQRQRGSFLKTSMPAGIEEELDRIIGGFGSSRTCAEAVHDEAR